MIIDTSDFRALSEMAKVPISEDEFDARLADFQKILAFVQQIESVKLPDDFVEFQPTMAAARSDDPHSIPQDERDGILANFPNKVDDYLSVNKVL
jgi:aspartyl/glutamyl-tRNA(Asn/Gln) amidotransferase C subunit